MTKQTKQYWARLIFEKALNALIFYFGWVLCIFFAASHEPWWGIGITSIFLFFHCLMTRTLKKDLILIGVFVILGFFVDSLYSITGVVAYESPNPFSPHWAPFWILTIWAVFAVSINHSMWWLKKRYFLAALLGAWGGVASYVAGERLGAAHFPESYLKSVLVIGGVWFFLLPLLMTFSVWLDQRFPDKY